MKLATVMARKGLMTAVIVCALALGTGHVMQTVLADQNGPRDATPVVPDPPEEALIPIVLKTPPAPRWPENFG